MKTFLILLFSLLSVTSQAADFCVSGVKGTVTGAFTFKVSQNHANERSITVYDNAKNTVFTNKTDTQFTQFNSTGYGVCSLAAQGTDETTGAQYKLELKVSPHYAKACKAVTLPATVEYLTLKIIPKGTTLGDDLTAYALSPVPCP